MYRFTKVNGQWLGKRITIVFAACQDIQTLVDCEEVVCISDSKEIFASLMNIEVSEIKILS